MEIKSTISLNNSKVNFNTSSVDTILDAGLRANISLPHGCKLGQCGACIARLVEGIIKTSSGDIISSNKKEQNKVLLCQSVAKSELVIIEYPDNILQKICTKDQKNQAIGIREFFVEVISNRQITPLVSELKVFVPEKLNFKFEAGMHLDFINTKLNLAKKYSICNTPDSGKKAKNNILRFLIAKHNKNGLSEYLSDKAYPGNILNIKGPYNSFIFGNETEKPILALAGGTGIAPILPILESKLKKNSYMHVMLILSVRSRKEILEMDRLYELYQKYSNFAFKVTLTREDATLGTRFLHGRINKVLPKIFKDLSGHNIFICGSNGFVENSKKIVVDLKGIEEKIFTEIFS